MQDVCLEAHEGSLTVRQSGDAECVRLHFKGELDLAGAKLTEQALDEAIASGKDVIVDLTALEFLDSTGIALFVWAMRGDAGRISFLPSESLEVSRVLRITGVDERMGISTEPEPFSFFSAA